MKFLSRVGLLALLWFAPLAHAQEEGGGNQVGKVTEEPTFQSSLTFQTGTVAVPEAHVQLQLSDNFRYLGHEDARRVLEEYWGNPPDDSVLGMLIPTADDLDSEHSWAVVLTYSEDGYVSDADANEIDYDSMLADMKEETSESNDALSEAGYDTVELLGWAQAPRYDANSKRLHWAKELKFSSSETATVNYDIRVLGRAGYLSLNAIGDIGDLDRINAGMNEVLSMAQFDDGHRYADYKEGTDKLAAYGVGALVAGGLASKAGLFAKLGILVAKFWKIGLIAVVAIGALGKKLLSKQDTPR
ncbi:MAG: DUF2167 domain-containing protein [Pseudomarimonas sp.]